MATTKIDLAMWNNRIQKAEALLNERRQERLQTIKLYTGTFFGSAALNTNSELSEVNFVYEFVDVLLSAIYARDPHIFVRSRSSKYSAFAETMETVINYYFPVLKMKKKITSALLDAILQPPGWIGLGYKFLTEKRNLKNQVTKEFPELKDLDKPQKEESQLGILDETIKEDDVFAEHLSSWNVMFPDGYHNIRDCPYLIVKQTMSLDALRRNPMYKDVKNKINGVSTNSQTRKPEKFTMNAQVNVMPQTSSQMDPEFISVDVFHVWDRVNMQRFSTVRNFTEDTIFEKEWDYLSEGFPQFPLFFNEIPATDEKANAYPLSDVVPMFPQLKELSYLSSAMMRHRRRAGTLILGKKGAISETDVANIQNASDVDMHLLDDISENSLRGFTPPPLPQDFYNLRNVILEDLMRISGFAQLLAYNQGVETATESENVRQGAVLRTSRKVDVVEDFIADIAVYLSGLIWEFKQDKAEIGQIVGEEVSEEMWPTLPTDRDEARRIVQKELFFNIEAGSTRPPKDEAVERKQWMDITGSLKANFPNRIKDDVYIKQLLKKFDFKDIEQLVIGFDDEETAAAQEENKLLMQGMPQIVGPNENDLLHLQVHGQVYQTPGMKSTPMLDKHVDDHAKSMERKNPKANPQRGDSKTPTATTTPDQARQGVTGFPDILQSISAGGGMGGEKGRA